MEEGDPPGRRDRAKTIIHAACTLYIPTRDTAHMSRTHARNNSMASESERLKRMQVLWRSRLPPSSPLLFLPHLCRGKKRKILQRWRRRLKARRRSRINDFQRKKESSPIFSAAKGSNYIRAELEGPLRPGLYRERKEERGKHLSGCCSRLFCALY